MSSSSVSYFSYIFTNITMELELPIDKLFKNYEYRNPYKRNIERNFYY